MGGTGRCFKIWLEQFKGNRDAKCQNLPVTEITYRAGASFKIIRMPKVGEHGAV